MAVRHNVSFGEREAASRDRRWHNLPKLISDDQ